MDVSTAVHSTIINSSSMNITMNQVVDTYNDSQNIKTNSNNDSNVTNTIKDKDNTTNVKDNNTNTTSNITKNDKDNNKDNDIKKETSPQGRYAKLEERLGSGAYKDVFRAYDTNEGIEVAWNVVKLARIPPSERKRIKTEVKLLKDIEHKNVIKYYNSWVDREKEQIVFITELCSGSLKDYLRKNPLIRWNAVKRWCRQILRGIEFLHNNKIIHRDIKCDNIFINGATGDLRIGDLGLSTRIAEERAENTGSSSNRGPMTASTMTCLGTPEFMAPELYEENYDEKVDIYAFGMCLLEMVTGLMPYHQCTSAAQIYKKVIRGDLPPELDYVSRSSVRAQEFIKSCLQQKDKRPSASELLALDFLKPNEAEDYGEVRVKIDSTVEPIAEGDDEEDDDDEEQEQLEDRQHRKVKEIISPSRENTPPLYSSSIANESYNDNENKNINHEYKRVPIQLINSDGIINPNDINITVPNNSNNNNNKSDIVHSKLSEKTKALSPINSDNKADDITTKENRETGSIYYEEKLNTNDNKPALISIRRATPDLLQASVSLEVDYVPQAQAKWSVSQEFNVGDLKQSTSRVRRRLVPSTPHSSDNNDIKEGRLGTSPTMRGSWDKFGDHIILGQDEKQQVNADDVNRKDSQVLRMSKVVSIMNLEDHPTNQDSLVFFLRAPVIDQEREVEVEFEFDLNHDDARAILEEMKDCDELADTPVDIEQIMKSFNPLVETAKQLLRDKVSGKSLADAVIVSILSNAKDTNNPSLKTLRERKQHLLSTIKRDNSNNNFGLTSSNSIGTPQRNGSREFSNDNSLSPKILSSSNLNEYNNDDYDDDSLNFEVDESDPLYQEILNEHNIALSKIDKEYMQRMINVGGAREKMEESHKKELEALADRQKDLKKQLHAMQEKFKERMLDFEAKKQAIIEQARKQASSSSSSSSSSS